MLHDLEVLASMGISGVVSGGLTADRCLDQSFFISLLTICKSKVLCMVPLGQCKPAQ